MNAKRRNIVFGIPMAALALTGCANEVFMTQKLYKKPTSSYVETVSSVLITQDGKKIVVMVQPYHYIFDASPALVAALKAPFHSSIEADLGKLYLRSSSSVRIDYVLSLAASATPEEEAQAVASGFLREGSSRKPILRGVLEGTRYDAKGVTLPAHSSLTLNRPYRIEVESEFSAAEKSVRVLATPIAVAADGALILVTVAGGILLLPLVVGFLAAGGAAGGAIGIGP